MTKVKICGVTSLDDAELAISAGAWAVGLVFHRASPRRCRLEDAVAIGAAVQRRVELAGVFVNRPLDEVVRVADEVALTLIQLHGDEGPAYCAEARRRSGCRVIKAARVQTRADVQALASFHTDLHLADAHVDGRYGGTGTSFDWSLLSGRGAAVPLILSGGLTPDTVAAGIAAVSPWAVDVASGVEAEPGRKDPDAVVAFVAAAHAATASAAALEGSGR